MSVSVSKICSSIQVVVVDDDPRCGKLMSIYLERIGCKVRLFADSRACLADVRQSPPDIVLTDLYMPALDGLGLLREIKLFSPSTDVIMMTGGADKDVAIQALKLGAFDFFEKPFDGEELIETIKRTVRYRTAIAERDRFAAQLSFVSEQEAQRWGIDAFVGKSDAMQKLLQDIRLLQQSANTSVLITGESGTGKELVARAIHFGSARASRPFVPVNCSAIPADLAESTLFGHVRGAFTGANTDRKGCFELADEGTLFLDEICDMPQAMQSKLLRVLEDGVVTPVGASAAKTVNVRVIAATNADVKSYIDDKLFRTDLFYRLTGFSLHLPPLRERIGDVGLLTGHFLKALASEMGLPPVAITPKAMQTLEGYHFPGNIRELRNMIERALIKSGGREVLDEHLQFLDIGGHTPHLETAPAALAAAAEPVSLAAAECAVIRRAMQAADGNVSEAARLLGISRSKLNRKVAALQN